MTRARHSRLDLHLRLRQIALAALLAAWPAGAVWAAPAESFPVEIAARPIGEFRIGRAETHFGPLEFVGGLELTGSSRHLGALSAFRFLDDGQNLLGVADTGFWFAAHMKRDAEGRPSGLSGFSMQPILDEAGQESGRKWEVDAEGLAIRDRLAIVGFERNHRIAEFRLDPGHMGAPVASLPFLVPARELRQNRGFETVAVAPAQSALKGALVIVSEKSLDSRGDIFAAVLDGPLRGVFTVKRNDPFDITDGDFLPNGDLLLLERSFSMAEGVAMRLRLIPGASIRPGAVADRQHGGARRVAARRRRRHGVADVGRQPLDPAAEPLSGVPAGRVGVEAPGHHVYLRSSRYTWRLRCGRISRSMTS
jgi:hypothetical protein